MTTEPLTAIDARVRAVLNELGRAAVAVSGGVDSLTLATVAGRTLGPHATMMHAVSPAVPPVATERVRREAERQGWHLVVLDAGEFNDPAYRANPANRCFYCKSNLYGAMAARTDAPIVSGTNLDDLDDVRPGLAAAAQFGVRHPFVEASIGKADVRRLARDLGLPDIAALPASPCLSSRIETGLAIEPPMLALVHEIETLVGTALDAETVRCRVRRDAIDIELDGAALERLDEAARVALVRTIEDRLAAQYRARPIGFAVYRRGSAFLDARNAGNR